MRKIDEIIAKYTSGEADLKATNEALEKAGYDIRLDPDKNVLTLAEQNATVIGDTLEQINGYGLLDSGTGTFDKVKVVNGRLTNCDMGNAFAMLLIGGHTYYIDGNMLTTTESKKF